jgi:CHASE2 domain-containing sensor protein
MKLPMSLRALKILAVALLAALVTCVFLNLRVFNFLFVEDWFEARAVNHMSNFVGKGPFDPNVKIVLIREKQHDGPAPWGDSDRKHREFFGQLIRAMTTAQAKVLAFDVAFDGNSPDLDPEFGKAVADARASGLTVIVGAEKYDNGKLTPEIPAAFNQPKWGLITVGAYQGNEESPGPIRAIKLADVDVANGSAVVPSLPLRIVMDSQAFVPELQEEWNRLILYSDQAKQQVTQTIPLERGKYLFIDQASPSDLDSATVDAHRIVEDFNNPEVLRKNYQNAIVLVGYEMGEARDVLAGGKRLGVQLHATAVSNILRQVYIYRLYLVYSYAIIVVMALLALLMDTSVGKRLRFKVEVRIPWTDIKVNVPLGLVIMGGVYLVIAILTFMFWRIYLDVPYHLAALVISYFLLWLAFTKIFPQKEVYLRP